MLNVKYDGLVYVGWEPDELLDAGVPNTMVQAAEAEAAQRDQVVRIRQFIHQTAGDPESLLGTTADAVQILLYEVGKLASALNTAQSLAEVRAAAQSLTDALGPLVTAVDGGTVKLPYQVKGGATAVMPEIEHRATQVATILDNGGQ